MSENVVMLIVLPTLLLTFASVVKHGLDTIRRNRLARMQSDMFSRLIDRFQNSQDLVAYLQSDAGKKLFENAPVDKANPFARIMNSIQLGIVVTVVAGTLLLIRGMITEREAHEPLLILGSLLLALGLGLLASGAAAWFMSKKFGLFNGETKQQIES